MFLLGTVQNPSFYKRTFYIFICQEALNVFSTAYFKKHFFLALLTLAGIYCVLKYNEICTFYAFIWYKIYYITILIESKNPPNFFFNLNLIFKIFIFVILLRG